jgi:hypothetical protein
MQALKSLLLRVDKVLDLRPFTHELKEEFWLPCPTQLW